MKEVKKKTNNVYVFVNSIFFSMVESLGLSVCVSVLYKMYSITLILRSFSEGMSCFFGVDANVIHLMNNFQYE